MKIKDVVTKPISQTEGEVTFKDGKNYWFTAVVVDGKVEGIHITGKREIRGKIEDYTISNERRIADLKRLLLSGKTEGSETPVPRKPKKKLAKKVASPKTHHKKNGRNDKALMALGAALEEIKKALS